MTTCAAAWPLVARPRAAAPVVARPMPSDLADSELVARIGREDREAFRLFYDRYAGRILAYVRQLSREREVAEDVVQEVFLAIWRKAPSYRPERGDVAGWLYTITRNRVVDRWRRKAGAVEDDGFDLTRLEADERDAAGRVTDMAVRQALTALTPEQRQAVELAYFGGLTYEEAARRLAVPLGTLKSRIRAALGRMRGVLESPPAA